MVAISVPTPLPLTRPTRRPPLRLVEDQGTVRAGLEWSKLSRIAWALGGLVAAVAFVALVALPGLGTPRAAAVDTHVVGVGETMWSIAVEHAPAGEAATYVERLVAANGTAAPRPGAELVLPGT